MNIWGSKTLRRLALPLAVVSLGAALTGGWGQSLASTTGGGTASIDPNAPDPEVATQSIAFVLVPKGNDNFRPENACGGAPTITVPPAAHPFGSGVSELQKLSIGPSRCTLAIFTPNSKQGEDLKYSSKPCAVTNAAVPGSVSLKFVGLRTPDKLAACTAPVFLQSQNPDLTAAQDAAGKLAVHDWAGSSCKPGVCRLIATLVQNDGDFNAPGLCSAAFYLTGPCTVGVIDTNRLNPATTPVLTTPGSVPSTPITPGPSGGATLSFSGDKCPVATSLSNRGDIQDGCTNLPFKPADMSFTLPGAATAAVEFLGATPPCGPFPATTVGCTQPAKHSAEIADQAMTFDLTPVKQFEFDPSNSCGFDGIKPVTRCLAAILNVPGTSATTGSTGGTITFPQHRCKLDNNGNKPFASPCFAQPFSPFKGQDIIKNFPAGVTCHQAVPQPVSAAAPPQVACQIYVTLTREDGDFNAENPCGNLSSATSVGATCLLMSANTDGRHEGDDITLTSSTPICLGNQVVDGDNHTSCIADDSVVPASPAPPASTGSLRARLIASGTPITVTIPEDPVLGSNQ